MRKDFPITNNFSEDSEGFTIATKNIDKKQKNENFYLKFN